MVSLKPMSRQMCHEFYKDFQNDPAIGHYYEYVYSPEIANRYFDNPGRGENLLDALSDWERSTYNGRTWEDMKGETIW